MRIENISIVIEPRRLSPTPEPEYISTWRQLFQCDRLAKEFETLTRTKVTVEEDFLHSSVQRSGFILLYYFDLERSINECQPEFQKSLLERTVLMSESGSKEEIFSLINQYNLAGVVADRLYDRWLVGLPANVPELYGLTSIAQEMNLEFSFEEGRYCSMMAMPSQNLLEVLIDYLNIYFRFLSATSLSDN